MADEMFVRDIEEHDRLAEEAKAKKSAEAAQQQA